MIGLPKSSWIWLVILAVSINAAILFIVIPKMSNRLRSFYNQNESIDGYDQLAINLLNGNGYRTYPDTAKTLSREPGYPILLAGIFFILGNSIAAVKLANLVLALGAAWLMTRIARRVSSSQVMIALPPLLFLFHPGTLIAESRVGVELLFSFLLMLVILTLYRAIESNRSWDYAISGLALGLTVLVRSTPILFPLILLAYLAFFQSNGSKLAVCRHIALMVIAMFTVLSPWIIRNYLLTGKFIPTASILGISAHAGLYDNTHLTRDTNWVVVDRASAEERKKIALELGYPFKPVKGAYYQDFYFTGDELKFSSYLLHTVISEYEKSPVLFIRCLFSNFFNLWFRGKTSTSTILNVLVQFPYLIFAAVGVLLAVRENQIKIIAPMGILLLYFIAVYVAILAQARYSVPLIPILSIFAGITLAASRRRFAVQEIASASA